MKNHYRELEKYRIGTQKDRDFYDFMGVLETRFDRDGSNIMFNPQLSRLAEGLMPNLNEHQRNIINTALKTGSLRFLGLEEGD